MLENNINQEQYSSHKSYCMTGTTDDNLGRRLFQVQKEKAVEDALEKIRRGMGSSWSSVSLSDSEILKEILGEVWISIDRHRWSTYSFSKLSQEDIKSLVDLGKNVTSRHSLSDEKIRQLDIILGRTV
jgi:hypothetical protein